MGPSPTPENAANVQKSMAYLESRLQENGCAGDYLTGDTATLADLVVANCLSHLTAVPPDVVDLNDYPSVDAWLKRVTTLGNYADICAPFERFVAGKAEGQDCPPN
jgi:glutathione S-transferase